jgi:hypothetical protein
MMMTGMKMMMMKKISCPASWVELNHEVQVEAHQAEQVQVEAHQAEQVQVEAHQAEQVQVEAHQEVLTEDSNHL